MFLWSILFQVWDLFSKRMQWNWLKAVHCVVHVLGWGFCVCQWNLKQCYQNLVFPITACAAAFTTEWEVFLWSQCSCNDKSEPISVVAAESAGINESSTWDTEQLSVTMALSLFFRRTVQLSVDLRVSRGSRQLSLVILLSLRWWEM